MIVLIDLIVVAVGVAFALHSRRLRTIRTYALLAALAVALVGAEWVPSEPARFVMKGLIVAIYVLAILAFQHVLAGLSRAEADTDNTLRAVAAAVNAGLASWQQSLFGTDPARVVSSRVRLRSVCETSLATLDGIEPPSRPWQQAVTEMRRYIVAIRDSATTSASGADSSGFAEVSISQLTAMRDEVNAAWAVALGRP